MRENIAQLLLQIQAVKINIEEPFKWTSGWLSPFYCDNRITLSYPQVRNEIKNAFVQIIKKEFKTVELIAGVATSGIPYSALIADALNLPMIYVRPEPKKHGLKKQIEGHFKKNQNVVVIEDLISTGGSSLL